MDVGRVPSNRLPDKDNRTMWPLKQATPVQSGVPHTGITGTEFSHTQPFVNEVLSLNAADRSHIATCSGSTDGAKVGGVDGRELGQPLGIIEG